MEKQKIFGSWFLIAMRLICGFLLFNLILYITLMYKGIFLPSEAELHYSTGIIKTYKKNVGLGKGGAVMISATILAPKNSHHVLEFDCTHTVLLSQSSCLSTEEADLHKNQLTKVGYYYQKRILWLHNPHPQLVTIEVNGSKVRSYQDTKDSLRESNRSILIFLITFDIFFIGIWFISDYAFRKV